MFCWAPGGESCSGTGGGGGDGDSGGGGGRGQQSEHRPGRGQRTRNWCWTGNAGQWKVLVEAGPDQEWRLVTGGRCSELRPIG